MEWRLSSRLAVAAVAAVVSAAAVLSTVAVIAAARSDGDRPDRSRADVGFLQDMIDHHEQATLMSGIALRGEASLPVRNLALDVIAFQRYEIGMMEGWLIDWGFERGQPGREAMVWMGSPVPVESMPGMAGVDDLANLSQLSGSKLDVRFLELMLEHHQGGVHMAEAGAELARNPHVRWLAGQMTRNQQREIADIERLLPD
jgi:uncharacterized protein (DUF305 family)